MTTRSTRYEAALTVRADFAEALFNRGNALLALKRPEEALASYDRTLTSSRTCPEVLANRGAALAQLGRLDEALAATTARSRSGPTIPTRSRAATTCWRCSSADRYTTTKSAVVSDRPAASLANCTRPPAPVPLAS